MTHPVVEIIVNGQLDDVDEDTTVAPQSAMPCSLEFTPTPSTALTEAPRFDPREGQAFIDEEILEWSEEDEDDEEALESEEDEKYDDWESNRLTSVDDEDWEIAERGAQYMTFSFLSRL
jgi:hypothetical protein